MSKLANVDASGNLLGFYDPALNTNIPASAVALTDAQYAAWFQNPTGLLWNAATASLAAAPTAAPPPAKTPQSITIFQAKALLFGMAGAETGKTLLDDVNAWVTAQGGLLALAWTEATVVTRTGNFVGQAAVKFGWNSAQLDAMFTTAAAIQA